MDKKHNNFLTAAMFPNRCPFCDSVIRREENICSACRKLLPKVPIRRFAIGGSPCVAALPYLDQYAAAVKRFKFRKRAFYAPALAEVMTEAVRAEYDLREFDCVTCVPMHPKDMRRRRFNHSELLARECAAVTGLPYFDLLEKCRRNKPQHRMRLANRAANVKNVFCSADKSLSKKLRVLLIDDIITSGNTLGECVRILEKAGYCGVRCAVVCSTLLI